MPRGTARIGSSEPLPRPWAERISGWHRRVTVAEVLSKSSPTRAVFARLRLEVPGENGMVVTRIVLIRHASTDPGGRLCGSFDVPLSPAGDMQLQELVARVPTQAAPDALFTSTLCRAHRVAAALGRAWGLTPQAAAWAREIHCGEVEGMPLDQLRRDCAELWRRNEAQDDETFAWPGGETYRQFRERILNGLRAVAGEHAGGRVAVVTHAGVVSQVLGIIRNRPASAWAADRPDPLTATEISWSGSGPSRLLAFNRPDWY
jgi:broad specificity phosphatase PhoE